MHESISHEFWTLNLKLLFADGNLSLCNYLISSLYLQISFISKVALSSQLLRPHCLFEHRLALRSFTCSYHFLSLWFSDSHFRFHWISIAFRLKLSFQILSLLSVGHLAICCSHFASLELIRFSSCNVEFPGFEFVDRFYILLPLLSVDVSESSIEFKFTCEFQFPWNKPQSNHG